MNTAKYLKECHTLYTAMVNTGVKVKKKLSAKDKVSPKLMMEILDKGTDDADCPDNQFDKFNELAKEFDDISDAAPENNTTTVEDPAPETENGPTGTSTGSTSTNTGTAQTKEKVKKTRTVKPDADLKGKAILDLFANVPKKDISNLKSSTMLVLLEIQKG